MRPLWKGFITFGLVSVPIKLYTAAQSKSISFTLTHRGCGHPVQYRKFCEVCEKEITQDDILKSFEFAPGQFVGFTEEELREIPRLRAKQIEISDFVDLEEIDPVYFKKSYYLAPGEGGEKPYALLLKAMLDSNRAAIARIVLSTKENIAAIRVYEKNTLSLSTIYYPDEIKQPETLDLSPDRVTEKELSMAKLLIDSLTSPFEPKKYHDNFRETLKGYIQRKIADEKFEAPPEPVKDNLIDLTETLRLSLEKIRGEKAEPAKTGS